MSVQNKILDFELKEGEQPVLLAQLTGADGNAADLTGRTVVFNMRRLGTTTPIISAGACTVVTPSGTVTISGGNGTATFSTSQAGVLANGFRITLSSGTYTLSNFDGTTTGVLSRVRNDVREFAANGSTLSFTASGIVRYTGTVSDTTTYQGEVEADFLSYITGQTPTTTAAQPQKFPNGKGDNLYGYISPKIV